jgi:pyruvate,orthophosphate dikinase
VNSDTDLDAADMRALTETFKGIVSDHVSASEYPQLAVDGKVAFPQDATDQLHLAIEAVFKSWNNRRAIDYRRMEKIDGNLGTAVNVQTMVFGNKGDTSATGVAFTRNPADGTNEFYGDFLTNAQGEDVVAGIRNTQPIAELRNVLPKAADELYEVFTTLENHYRDMCDIEFTIEQGKLWMLQTRVGKRTARAALKVAVDMVEEGMISREEAVLRIDPAQLDQLLHPQFDASATYDVEATDARLAGIFDVVFNYDLAQDGSATMWGTWKLTNDKGTWVCDSWRGAFDPAGNTFTVGRGEGTGSYEGLASYWQWYMPRGEVVSLKTLPFMWVSGWVEKAQ